MDSLFQLHYHLEANVPHCGGHYTSSMDTIILNTMETVCLYLIEQPVRDIRIEINFVDVSRLPLSDCDLYKLEIYDGPTLNDPLLLRFCGAEQLTKITSTRNYLLIRFQHNFHKRMEQNTRNFTQSRNVIPLCKIKYRRGKLL